jgi:Grx4 family monothiol glutaredoxin
MSNFIEATTDAEVQSLLKEHSRVVLVFWVEWAPPSTHVRDVCKELSGQLGNTQFVSINAEKEETAATTETYGIATVPIVVACHGGKEVTRIDGADVPQVSRVVNQLALESDHAASNTESAAKQSSQNTATVVSSMRPPAMSDEEMDAIGDILTGTETLVLVKEGVEDGPTDKLKALLSSLKIAFTTSAVPGDSPLAAALKKYTSWPMFPMMFVKGSFLGGWEVVNAMHTNGTLAEVIKGEETVRDRIERLIRCDEVVVFMKGTREAPRCGFSRKIIELLQKKGVEFTTYNILEDEELRQELKEFSRFPTYPQVWWKAELLGGLDILSEMEAEGELNLPSKTDKLKALINQEPVMLFMKGVPEAPRCGFSRRAVAMLKENNIPFGFFDILSDEIVRQGLKAYSNWPTYPQLYVRGTLLGGVDIMAEMAEDGELSTLLEE